MDDPIVSPPNAQARFASMPEPTTIITKETESHEEDEEPKLANTTSDRSPLHIVEDTT